MQSLKSIRLAEVGNFFKQSFEQKKTDSTVFWSMVRKTTPAHRMLPVEHASASTQQQMPYLPDCEEHHTDPNEQWVEAN